MTDDAGLILFFIFYAGVSLVLLLLCGRIIGWLLGISRISQNQEIIMDQNDSIISLLESSFRLQQEVAREQGILLEPDEDQSK